MKQVGSRRMSKSNNILQYCSFWNTIPLTPNLFGGVFPPSKVFFLSVSPNEVVGLFGIDVEHVLPCRPDPLGGDCDEAEEKALHPARGLHPEHAHERQDAKCTVYEATQRCVKFVQHEINSAKAVILSFFCAIFAMSVGVLLTCFCTTKVSEISDMTKS